MEMEPSGWGQDSADRVGSGAGWFVAVAALGTAVLVFTAAQMCLPGLLSLLAQEPPIAGPPSPPCSGVCIAHCLGLQCCPELVAWPPVKK